MPATWASILRSVTPCRSACSMCRPSGSSRSSFPSSRRTRIAAATKVFVIDATAYCVSGEASRSLSTSARPIASLQRRSFSRKSAALTLGAGLSACSRRISRRSSATSASGADKGPERLRNRLGRAIHVRVLDPEVRCGADDAGSHIADTNTLVGDPGRRVGERKSDRLERNADEVRLDRLHVHGQPVLRKAFGEALGTGVILGEAIDVVVERVQRGGRNDAGLPHRAAEKELLPPRQLDALRRRSENGAERAAEAL